MPSMQGYIQDIPGGPSSRTVIRYFETTACMSEEENGDWEIMLPVLAPGWRGKISAAEHLNLSSNIRWSESRVNGVITAVYEKSKGLGRPER
jgi:hypothetical protein